MATTIAGISVPDSKLAREIMELVRDTESPLLFHRSSRVFYWGALTGVRRGLTFDAELLYAGAMFHDMGLTKGYSSPNERFEVDGANAARDSCVATGYRSRISTRGGPRSRSTPHLAFRSTCTGDRAGDGGREDGRAGHCLQHNPRLRLA
jgi:hypothetical protein